MWATGENRCQASNQWWVLGPGWCLCALSVEVRGGCPGPADSAEVQVGVGRDGERRVFQVVRARAKALGHRSTRQQRDQLCRAEGERGWRGRRLRLQGPRLRGWGHRELPKFVFAFWGDFWSCHGSVNCGKMQITVLSDPHHPSPELSPSCKALAPRCPPQTPAGGTPLSAPMAWT